MSYGQIVYDLSHLSRIGTRCYMLISMWPQQRLYILLMWVYIFATKIQNKKNQCHLTPGTVTGGLLPLPQFYSVQNIQNIWTTEVTMSMCQISDRVQSIYLQHHLIQKMISMFAVMTSFPGGGGGGGGITPCTWIFVWWLKSICVINMANINRKWKSQKDNKSL